MRHTFPLICLLLLFAAAYPTLAQQELKGKIERARELKRVSENLDLRYTANRQQALQLARKKGWVVSETTKAGATISLQGVDERGMPVYHVTYDNVRAAATTGTDQVWPGGPANLTLTGGNPALADKLAIWDGGRVRATHQELGGRVVQRDGAYTNDNHATHVAGTMIASGANSRAKGMAHEARSLQAWDFNNDIPEIAAAAGSLLVSNHSYGSTAGWRYNPNRSPRWEWWGDITVSTTEDNKFGQYNAQARDFDQIAYYAPYYLMVKAAGNNRTESGPAEGSSFWRINAARTFWELVDARPAGMSSNNSYESIPTYGNSKNILMVGAVNPIDQGYSQPLDVKIAPFSSWGPTDDGRIKPDLVGNGVSVMSSTAGGDATYATYSGTSMASPNVAGSLFLLQEHYANRNNGSFMQAATLKGLAIHTADEAGGAPGPDYVHGWGLLNTNKAAAVLSNPDGRHAIYERTLSQNETYTFQITAAGAGPLVITISWTDPEGSAASALNDRTPKLVNDLDVRVTRNLTAYLPWVLDPANPSFPATPGDNIRDNVEQVFIANPVPGETYTVSVRHKGVLQRGPQAYSLLISGISSPAYCVSGAQAEADSRIEKVVLGSFSHTSAGCATYRDLTSLSMQVQAGQAVPFSIRLGTCGEVFSKAAMVFVDWNSDHDFNDVGEAVAASGLVRDSADFKGTFTVPAALVKAGDKLRLRIVLTETENPEQVKACGAYAKGETQDYQLLVLPPATDVGVTGLVFPAEGLCANPAQSVTVSVRNFGTATQTGISVTTVVRDAGETVATLQGTLSGSLAPLREASLTLTGHFTAAPGKTYSFASMASLPGDQDLSNDGFSASRTVSSLSPSPTAKASVCGSEPVLLQASGTGPIYWYDAPAGGNLLATGEQAVTAIRPPDHTYYAAVNDFSGSLGPKAKNAFAGGSYNQYSTKVYFTAQVPLMLEKARLYIGNPGRITLTMENANGEVVSRATLDVAATRNPAGYNSQSDDPEDTGAVYDLNLTVPEPGEYAISIAYEHGATLFRNNAGVTGYPFTIPGVLSVTGNSASEFFYYYFYDLQIKALGCPSARVPVIAETNTGPVVQITPAGPTTICQGEVVVLQTPAADGYRYQWQKDGAAIEGAISASFRATETGDYRVTVTDLQNPKACSNSSTSDPVTVAPAPAIANTIAASQTICLGSVPPAIQGSEPVGGNGGYAYLWESSTAGPDTGFGPAPGFNKGMHYAPDAMQQPTWFRRTVFSGNCADVSPASLISVKRLPAATITETTTTLCQGSTTQLTAHGGSKYVWSTGATTQSITVTESGTYTATVLNEESCTTIANSLSVYVTLLPASPVISQNGNMLSSNYASGNQWYRNGIAIKGATGPKHEAFLSGEYTVVITQNGCQSAPSAPVAYSAAITEETMKLTVFPNPIDGPFTLSFEVQGSAHAQLSLLNMFGQEVYRSNLPHLSGRQSLPINPGHLAKGIYLLQLQVRDKVFTRRIIVKN